jgi:hypothetical protein
MRPFAMTSVSQFRGRGPIELTGRKYAREFNEVKRYGSLDSTYSTPEQREVARFYIETASIQYPRIIRAFTATQNLSLVDNARLYAQLYVSIVDALIAGWDTKFHYNFWRPVTAIRQADTDGNPGTTQDASWLPLTVTPNHQEYPSTHSAITGALAITLKKFFRTPHIAITFSSMVTGTQRSFTHVKQLVDDILDARVYGGMHFRSSNEDGITMGEKVAKYVAKHYFRPRHGCDGDDPGDDAEPLTSAQLVTNSKEQENDRSIPGSFALAQNYPNPFNPTTRIGFRIQVSGFTSLKVYDMLGRELRTLVNENLESGSYEALFDATGLASGVYLYRLTAGGQVETKRLILMR